MMAIIAANRMKVPADPGLLLPCLNSLGSLCNSASGTSRDAAVGEETTSTPSQNTNNCSDITKASHGQPANGTGPVLAHHEPCPSG